MKASLRWLILGITLSLVTATSAASPQLIFGYVNFPPYTFLNEKAESDGQLIQTAKERFNANNIDPLFRLVPPARLFEEIEKGVIHSWFGIRVPKVQHLMHFSKKPVGQITLNLYRLASSPEHNLDTLPDSEGLILIHGWSYSKLRSQLEARRPIMTAPNNLSALKMLQLKRANYLLSYGEVINNLNTRPADLTFTNIQTLDIYFQVRKDFPGSEKIVQIFD